MDLIHLDDIAFPCIIGMYALEQERPQQLEVSLSLGLSLEAAADGDFEATVDYHGVLCDVQFVAQRGHFHMLESLGCALARLLLRPPGPAELRAQVQQARVTLRKPETLGEGPTPGVEINRSADEFIPTCAEPLRGIVAEALVKTRTTGVYRLLLSPGTRLSVGSGSSLQLIAGALRVADVEVAPHTMAPRGEVTAVVGAQGATVLCVSRPADLDLRAPADDASAVRGGG